MNEPDYLAGAVETEERFINQPGNCGYDRFNSPIPKTTIAQAIQSLLSNQPKTLVMGFYPDTPDNRTHTFVLEGNRGQAVEQLNIYLRSLDEDPGSTIEPGMPQSSQFEALFYLDKQDLAAELVRLDSDIQSNFHKKFNINKQGTNSKDK